MDHYFFDWRDNEDLEVDSYGMDLPDLQAVKVEASRALIERAHEVFPGSERHSLSIEVRDETGQPVLSIILILEIHVLQ